MIKTALAAVGFLVALALAQRAADQLLFAYTRVGADATDEATVYDCEDVGDALYDDSFEPEGGFHSVGQLRTARTISSEIEEAIGHE